MGHHGRLQLRLAIRYGSGAAVAIEELDSEVVVEIQPVGQFFWRVSEMRSAMTGSSAGALRRNRSVQYASQAHDFIQNPLRHFAFGHFRKREVASIAGKQRNDICVL